MEEKRMPHDSANQAQAVPTSVHRYRPIIPAVPSTSPSGTSPSVSYAIMTTSPPLNSPTTSLHSNNAADSLSVYPSNCSPGGSFNAQLSPANPGQPSHDTFSDLTGLVFDDLQNRVSLAEQNQDRLIQVVSRKVDALKDSLEASIKESCVAIARKLGEDNKNFLDQFKAFFHAHMRVMIENFAVLGRSIDGVKTSVNSVNARLVALDTRLKVIEEKFTGHDIPQAPTTGSSSAPPVANPVNTFQSSFLNQMVCMKATLVLLGTTIMEARNEALASDRNLMEILRSQFESQRMRMEVLHREVNALRSSLQREIPAGGHGRVIDNTDLGMEVEVDNARQGMVCSYVVWL